MRGVMRWVACAVGLAWGLGFETRGQGLLPNGGFEEGAAGPSGWRLADGAGEWTTAAFAGQRAIRVRGDGNDQSCWRTEDLPQGSGLYRLSFVGRREAGAVGGTAVSGPSRVNRDFVLTEAWEPHEFVFRPPEGTERDFVRLGQWQVRGQVTFDAAELNPVLAVHARAPGGFELGEGESVRQGVYRFKAAYGWQGANYHRTLATNRAGFNSNRWVFSPGTEVVYHHRLGESRQASAKVRVNVNYYVAGGLLVQASSDGRRWVAAGQVNSAKSSGWLELPASLFPAPEIWVRLSHAGDPGGFQVNDYDYEARLTQPPGDAEGQTSFLAILETAPTLGVGLRARERPEGGGGYSLGFVLTNRSAQTLKLKGLASSRPPLATNPKATEIRLAPGQTAEAWLRYRLEGAGEHVLRAAWLEGAGPPLFTGEVKMRVGFLEETRYGHPLAGPRDLAVWWCESGWKVGRDRPPPEAAGARGGPPLRVSAARGEYEAAQLVLRPAAAAVLQAVTTAPWRPPRAAAATPSLRVDEVAYVQVVHPTDGSCVRGWYPDPLPPLRGPVRLAAGQNQPLWLTFHVPPEAAPGDYHSQLELQTSLGKVVVPLAVHVRDFTLPKETHLSSALGLGAHAISQYHHLTDEADRRRVFELYLRNFAEHRISPYSFYDYAPIGVSFTGDGTNRSARLDFSRFDAAAEQWLDRAGFSTFQLPVQGMGGGTFQSRSLGELEGHPEGTPEHARLFKDYLSQVEAHLRQRGWLPKAFVYWFDEPDPKDYAFVVAGMARLKAAAPGLRRLLTEQPEPALMGHVDIWCGLTPEWTPEKVQARRAAGEEVWWYICTGPKAPYVTEFIDHPGTELRLWPWQSWQYGVKGLLIWATIYWSSPLVYPAPRLQDPWADPMSWVSGYDFPVGFISPWGNGDGRFLYPPRRDPNAPQSPCLDEPINSLRWENLRDGMEDYEYFWLLRRQIEQLAAAGRLPEALGREARGLLQVPASVSRDLTHFTVDPRPLLEHRERVAAMIERLQRSR